MKPSRAAAVLTLVVLLATLAGGQRASAETGVRCAQTGSETIATDKPDYAPEETVHMTGSGYGADCDVLIVVTRPDGTVVTGDGSFAEGSDTVTTDVDGNVVYDYILDGVEGTYAVDVLGEADTVLATTTFTDAVPASLGLFSDSGRTTAKQVFERGDTVYARGVYTAPDNAIARSRYNLFKPGGVAYGAPYPTGCLSGSNVDDSHTVAQAEPLSDTQRWNYRLRIYKDAATCSASGTPFVDRDRNFFVLQAYAYAGATGATSRNNCTNDTTCGSPTPRPSVNPGSTVFLRIRGFTANRANSDFRFIRPDGSIACTITGTTASATGAVSFDYPSGPCPAITGATSDVGAWTIDVAPGEGLANAPFRTNLDAFTVKAPTTVTTEVHDGTHTAGTSFPLGTAVHDKASVSGRVTGVPFDGNVDFSLFTGSGCVTANKLSSISGETDVAVTDNGNGNAGTAESAERTLGAGDYSYKAEFNGDSHYADSSGDCENFSVTRANTTTTTEVHNASHDDITNGYSYSGDPVHDHATIGTQVGAFAIGGTVDYNYFTNGTCTGTPNATDSNKAVTAGAGAQSFTKNPTDPGSYCFNAHYDGDANYNASDSDPEPFRVVPKSSVTSSSLCTFDVDGDNSNGRQFRLIYTPEQATAASKLNATNPGQTFYNVFYIGDGPTTLTLNIPAPYVTQGANPVHVYDGVTPTTTGSGNNKTTCFVPGNEISDGVVVAGAPITGTSGGTITVTLPAVDGFAYVAVHLDYGYKGILGGCSKDNVNTAHCTQLNGAAASINITSPQSYAFSSSGGVTSNQTVQSVNDFKKDPGIGGFVQHTGSFDPVPGASVEIYDSAGKKLKTVLTDVDGWYMWAYKYTGKATNFTVKLPAYGQQKTVTMKSNGYTIVSFLV